MPDLDYDVQLRVMAIAAVPTVVMREASPVFASAGLST